MISVVDEVSAQPSQADLEQARNHFIAREQTLKKARETLQEKINRMRESLDAQERRLHSVDLRLDETRKSIIDIEQKIVQGKPR